MDRRADLAEEKDRAEAAANRDDRPVCVECLTPGATLLGACRTRLYCSTECSAADDNLDCTSPTPRPCKNPRCVTGLPVRPATTPGDEGYCNMVCKLHHAAQVEAAALARDLRSPGFLLSAAGYRSAR
jgi:hypothetical protein